MNLTDDLKVLTRIIKKVIDQSVQTEYDPSFKGFLMHDQSSSSRTAVRKIFDKYNVLVAKWEKDIDELGIQFPLDSIKQLIQSEIDGFDRDRKWISYSKLGPTVYSVLRSFLELLKPLSLKLTLLKLNLSSDSCNCEVRRQLSIPPKIDFLVKIGIGSDGYYDGPVYRCSDCEIKWKYEAVMDSTGNSVWVLWDPDKSPLLKGK